ncbi:MAG: hemerythrin domain-containing protein [Alphaproteobacteria bacterium]|nr:hemerythrin domain-containing protein [Alphaproteobacteria bacterium]
MGLIDTLRNTITGDKEGPEENDDILGTLKQDHEDVADLLDRLANSNSATQRKQLLVSIKEALVPHLRAEEKVVYDAVRELRPKEQKTHAEEGYMEHALGDKMLLQLGKIGDVMSPEFSAAAKVLKELVEHHVQEEENNIWADIEDKFSDVQRAEMNREFLAAKKRVRVRARA